MLVGKTISFASLSRQSFHLQSYLKKRKRKMSLAQKNKNKDHPHGQIMACRISKKWQWRKNQTAFCGDWAVEPKDPQQTPC